VQRAKQLLLGERLHRKRAGRGDDVTLARRQDERGEEEPGQRGRADGRELQASRERRRPGSGKHEP
jgi:hypothetical protein